MNASRLFHRAIHALAPDALSESFVENESAVGQITPGAIELPREGMLP